jgi:molybdopterin-guanine dinucleotide biosynthesis protein MobB
MCDRLKSRKPLMVAFVGTSGSGKTAAMEYLTRQLTGMGFRVGVAKHIHEEGFTIDTVGKDTWRHAHAGARVVIGASPNELAIIKKTSSEAKFAEIAETLANSELDIALLEGFSGASDGIARIPKVVTAKDASDLKYTLSRTKPPILAITGRVVREHERISNPPAPLVDLRNEGFLLTSIVRRQLYPKEIGKMLADAAKRHGGTCIGLAVGIRAAYLTSNVFDENNSVPDRITCGTKHCIAEAFHTIYPKASVQIADVRDDQITIKSRAKRLTLKLAPKQKNNFTKIAQVLSVPDKVLFESVTLAS